MSETQLLKFGPLKFSLDWITRPVFGGALALLAIAVIFAGPMAFTVLTWVGSLACAREWHRMVGKAYLFEWVISALVFTIALTVLLYEHPIVAFAVLGAGAAVQFFLSLARRGHMWWQAGGVFYIGVPLLSFVALHAFAQHGHWIVLGLFIIVWATDTGALLVGNLLGGPKIAPVLSPNKTWSGTIGGLVAAVLVEAVYIGVLGGHVFAAVLFAVIVGMIAHAGDFFESWAKRKFQLKDIGTMIPGHGGVLDRVDSTLFSVTALAAAVFLFGLDSLFGAQL